MAINPKKHEMPTQAAEKRIFNYLIRQQVSKICHEFLPPLSGKKYWKEKEINCKVI